MEALGITNVIRIGGKPVVLQSMGVMKSGTQLSD